MIYLTAVCLGVILGRICNEREDRLSELTS